MRAANPMLKTGNQLCRRVVRDGGAAIRPPGCGKRIGQAEPPVLPDCKRLGCLPKLR